MECGRLLGEGTIARVYESTDKKYAIKIFKKDHPIESDYQYYNEIKIMQKLEHPNIIKLIDVSVTYS